MTECDRQRVCIGLCAVLYAVSAFVGIFAGLFLLGLAADDEQPRTLFLFFSVLHFAIALIDLWCVVALFGYTVDIHVGMQQRSDRDSFYV